jgi:hypothetical protein
MSDVLYKLWEEHGDMQSAMSRKVSDATKQLKVLEGRVEDIKKGLESLNTYKLEHLLELIAKFNDMTDADKRLFEVLLKNS